MYTTILTALDGGIFTITINRPDKLNALNKDVMRDLDKAFDEVEQNNDIKAVIITGSGQKGFVAGADISEFVGLSGEEGKALAKKGQDIFFPIRGMFGTNIAATVHGVPVGWTFCYHISTCVGSRLDAPYPPGNITRMILFCMIGKRSFKLGGFIIFGKYAAGGKQCFCLAES